MMRIFATCAVCLMLGSLQSASAAAPAASGRVASGLAVYTKWCAPCHDPGIMHPGTHALMVKYPTGSRASGVIVQWTDLPADYVAFMVRHGMSVMPPFRKTEITDSELAALSAYLSRNTPPK